MTDQPLWTAPSEFDQIKEMNTHAGRFATLYGLLITATSLTLISEPVRTIISPVINGAGAMTPTRVALEGVLVLGASALAVGVLCILVALDPAIPEDDAQIAYRLLLARKVEACAGGGACATVVVSRSCSCGARSL
jgi:hypothetical protein